MIHRTHRILASVALILLVIGAVIGGTSWWVISTDPGSKWGFERLGALLPGEIKIRDLDGPIRSPLVVHDISYANDRLEISAETVAISWRLGSLFQKQLEIRSLAAKNVKITFHARDVMPDTTILPDVDLPISILVHRGTIDSLRIYGISIPPDTALAIDHVELASSSFRDTLGIQELALTSRTLDARVVGTILPHGNYPLDLSLVWRYQTPSGSDVHGGGTLKGTVARLDLDQTITSPFTARLVGSRLNALAGGRFVGEAQVAGLKPQAHLGIGPEGTWSGSAHVEGIPEKFALRGTTDATGTPFGRVRAHGDVTRDVDLWSFREVVVSRPGARGQATARGTVRTMARGPAQVDARAEWRNLPLPLNGPSQWSSREGRAAIKGTLGAYDLKAQGLIEGPGLTATRFTMRGRGDTTHVKIAALDARVFEGAVKGRGTVAWNPLVRWDLALEGSGVNPGTRWRDWPGALDFALTTDGTAPASGPRGRVRVRRFAGTLRGSPVEGHGGFTFAGGSAVVDTMDVHVASARLTGRGAVMGPWNFAWTLDAPRLGELLPDAAGVLAANGSITGSRREPRVIAHVLADTIALRDARVAHLVGDFDVAASRAGAVVIDVHGDGLAWRTRRADSLAITARGTGGSHTLALTLDSRTESWRAGLAGGLLQGDWRGTVSALDLTSQRVGNWGLAAPAPLSLANSTGTAELGTLCWRSGGSSLCASGDWQRGRGWAAHAQLDSLRLALIEPLLSRDFRLEGRMDGTIDARADAAGAITGNVDLAPGPGQLAFLGATQPDSVAFDRGVLKATLGPAGLDANVAMTFAGTDQVAATLELPGFRRFGQPDRSQPVRGTLRAQARDLRFAQALFTDLADTHGRLDADLALAGTMGNPRLSGHLDLDSARAVVPVLGIALVEGQLHLRGEGGRQMAMTGSVRSGEGRVSLDGEATLAEDGTPAATVSILGNRFLAANTSDLKLVASPDLKAGLKGDRADLNGEIKVTEGAIDLQTRTPIVRPSPDVRMVGASPDTLPSLQKLLISANVRVVLGDSVRVAGQGLSGRTTGQILVSHVPRGTTRGSGELRLEEGTYEAYGQSFTVERGRLLFAGGSIMNPGLDLRATRVTTNNVTAGFEVRGTLEKPQMTVVSNPAMPDNEALSYALTGHPLGDVSQAQGALVAEAASSFAFQQGNTLASGVAKSLGLKEARLQAGETLQQTALFVGTQLTHRLYVSYGLGLFEALNVFRLRYLLNSSFTLEAESGKENRANLLFTRER